MTLHSDITTEEFERAWLTVSGEVPSPDLLPITRRNGALLAFLLAKYKLEAAETELKEQSQ
jgi:hypothetical protein